MDEKQLFEKAVDIVLEFEGYKTTDTGGRTIFGIAENSHPEAVKKMWDLPQDQAKEIAKGIYYEEYWKKILIEDSMITLPQGQACAICLFDTAINLGVERAKQYFENADAQLGMHANYKHITDRVLLARIEHYFTLAKKEKYRPYFYGWMNRVIKLRRQLWFLNQ